MHTPKLLFLSMLMAAGCGSSSTDVTEGTPSTTAPLPVSTTARVVDERGAAVSNVDVVLHERATNQKYVLKSDAQGALVLDMPTGVYDLALNSADANTATCFYGPVTLPAERGSTFVLHDSGGRPAGSLFGQLLSQPGKPLAGRQVVLSPTQITSRSNPQNPTPVPSPVTLRSGLDGSFEGNLGFAGPVGLDVEVYNADGTIDEFVDVSTLAKPCYVEFATEQSAATNRLRSNQSDGPDGFPLVNPKLASSETRAKLLTQFTAVVPSSALTIFTNGLLTIDSTNPTTYNFPDISTSPVGSGVASNRIYTTDVAPLWFTVNTINVYSATAGVGGDYQFTDQDGQVHSLTWSKNTTTSVTVITGVRYFPPSLVPIPVYGTQTFTEPVAPAWYKVSYTSTLPNLNRIHCQAN